MKALALLDTLEKGPQASNTEELLNKVLQRLKAHDVDTETIRLADNDEWKDIAKKMFAADIVIFATPIRRGQPSSLIQKVIERMKQIDDRYTTKGTSKLHRKIAGVIITGDKDGAQHIVGTLANALTWHGFVLPPECTAYWVGEVGSPIVTEAMIGVMAHNLYHYAKLFSAIKGFLGGKHKDIHAKSVTCSVCTYKSIDNIKLS